MSAAPGNRHLEARGAGEGLCQKAKRGAHFKSLASGCNRSQLQPCVTMCTVVSMLNGEQDRCADIGPEFDAAPKAVVIGYVFMSGIHGNARHRGAK